MTLRGQGINLPPNQRAVGLPPRPFLYTVDQLSVMLDLSEAVIMRQYLYFEGRSIGRKLTTLMLAVNISAPDEKPEWRVTEREFIRWMKTKGFRHYERSAFS